MTDLDALLAQTSRTFALAIPLLPEPTRREVTLAYLLFRIADTFEDGDLWPISRRVQALETFAGLLRSPDESVALELAGLCQRHPPTEHAGYRALLAQLPGVLAHFEALPEECRRLVGKHGERTALGMAAFVRATRDGGLAIGSVEALRDYCYTVAGIVGELLTDLFLLAAPALSPHKGLLLARARAFGEGLQLVNVLKDADEDLRAGRRFLPAEVPAWELFELARADLVLAAEYTLALQQGGAPSGLVGFVALPVLLARAALRCLEEGGPGAKVPRQEVLEIAQALQERLDRGAPALGAPEHERPAA